MLTYSARPKSLYKLAKPSRNHALRFQKHAVPTLATIASHAFAKPALKKRSCHSLGCRRGCKPCSSCPSYTCFAARSSCRLFSSQSEGNWLLHVLVNFAATLCPQRLWPKICRPSLTAPLAQPVMLKQLFSITLYGCSRLLPDI